MITRLNDARHRIRFALWVAKLRLRLKRKGARLIVDAPHTVRFDTPPSVMLQDYGEGERVTHLKFGKGVHLGRNTNLQLWALGPNRLELGDGVYFLDSVRVELRNGSIRMGRHCHARDGAVLKSGGDLTIGEEVSVSFWAVLSCEESVTFEDFSGVGERSSIYDADHSHDGSDTFFLRQPLQVEPVRVGRNTWLSADVTVLRGADIGANCVVGAKALVRAGTYEEGWLIAGQPARPIRRLASGSPEGSPGSRRDR